MNARDYTLIQGLPGTGKTSTLSFIARLLAACGKRVLITSYTHAAVDNVVLKLMEKGLADTDVSTGLPNLVRVGQSSSCHEGVRHLLAGELAKYLDKLMVLSQDKDRHSCLSQSESFHLENPSAQSLQQVLSSARIVCATALSVPRSPLLLHETFDVVIIDEAGQISQPAILGALMAADSFVLVGDHKQLPPLVNSEVAEAGGKLGPRLLIFGVLSWLTTFCFVVLRLWCIDAEEIGRKTSSVYRTFDLSVSNEQRHLSFKQ
jgi:DNA replication ATP-dependent helicase Dna2